MLGDEILKQRLGLGLSITELADKTNVDSDVISRLETRERKFILEENFNRLNQVLKLEDFRDYIFCDTGEILGSLIRQKRRNKKLKLSQVASLCGYKDKSSIAHIEEGCYSKITLDTFFRLQEVLDLDQEEFEPFIQKDPSRKGRIVSQNRELIQTLIKEKRTSLKLSQVKLGEMAHVSSNTIVKMELYPEKKLTNSKLLKVMKVLEFTKEEILSCFSNLEEKDLEEFFANEKEDIPYTK